MATMAFCEQCKQHLTKCFAYTVASTPRLVLPFSLRQQNKKYFFGHTYLHVFPHCKPNSAGTDYFDCYEIAYNELRGSKENYRRDPGKIGIERCWCATYMRTILVNPNVFAGLFCNWIKGCRVNIEFFPDGKYALKGFVFVLICLFENANTGQPRPEMIIDLLHNSRS